jgi:uncharacterized protein YecA (UPF0149 family)
MITKDIEEYFFEYPMKIEDLHDISLIADVGPRLSKKKRALLRPLSQKSTQARNELCACDSGKKYKHCCLTKPTQ